MKKYFIPRQVLMKLQSKQSYCEKLKISISLSEICEAVLSHFKKHNPTEPRHLTAKCNVIKVPATKTVNKLIFWQETKLS